MPNSLAITSARSRLRLAMATTFAPMQSRKPGICVVRANPVPIIPIPTGDLFMAGILYHDREAMDVRLWWSFSLRSLRTSAFSALKSQLKRRERRDTQRAAEDFPGV